MLKQIYDKDTEKREMETIDFYKTTSDSNFMLLNSLYYAQLYLRIVIHPEYSVII